MIDPNQLGAFGARTARWTLIEILLLLALALAPAARVWADAPEAADAPAEVAEAEGPDYVPCSELARLKYPFLRCVRGVSGRPVLAEEGPGMTGARLRFSGRFASGPGAWGDSGVE